MLLHGESNEYHNVWQVMRIYCTSFMFWIRSLYLSHDEFMTDTQMVYSLEISIRLVRLST